MSDDDELRRIIETHDRVEFRRRAGRLERDAWIAASRMIFDPGERQPCYVCGKFKSIAQAHHVVPLSAQYDRGFKYPDPEHVWLCPNHHTMAHRYILDDNRSLAPAAMRARDRSMAALFPDLSEAEFNKLMELMQRAGRSPE